MAENESKAIDGLEFDMSNITAGEMADFFDAVRRQDVRVMAATLTQIVMACPPSWGDPEAVETYLKLPFYGAFQGVIDAMGEASRSVRTR